MFASVVLGFIGPLLDAIDWGKLGGGLVVLAAAPVLYAIAHGIARRGVKSELDGLTDRLKNAGDSLRNAQTANQVNAIELATRNQTIAFHERTISHLQADAGTLKNYCGTLLDAGRRLTKELRDLRLVKADYDRLRACGENYFLFVLASLRVMIPMRATCTTALPLASVCS